MMQLGIVLLSFAAAFQDPSLRGEADAKELRETGSFGREHPLYSTASFTHAAASPGGASLAVFDADDRLCVWKLPEQTLACTVTVKTEAGGAASVLFLDEDRVAIVGRNGTCSVVRLSKGAVERTWSLGSRCQGAIVSGQPDESFYVLAGVVTAVNRDTGAVTRKFLPTSDISDPEPLAAIAVSPGGGRVYTAGRALLEWDAETGKPLRILGVFDRRASCMAIDPQGENLMVGFSDGLIMEWSVKEGTASAALNPPETTLGGIQWCGYGVPEAPKLALYTQGLLVRFRKEKSLGSLATRGRPTVSPVILRGSGLLALPECSGGDSHHATNPDPARRERFEVVLWDLSRGVEHSTEARPYLSRVSAMSVSKSGDRVLTVTPGEVILWDTSSGRRVPIGREFPLGVTAALSPDGKHIVWGAPGQKTIRILRVEDAGEDRAFEQAQALVSLTLSEDGSVAACASDLGVDILDLSSGKIRRSVPSPGDGILKFVLSSDGRYCALSDYSRALDFWDTVPGRRIGRHETTGFVGAIAIADDLETVYAYTARALLGWNCKSGTVETFTVGVPGSSLAPGPEGMICVAAGSRILCIDPARRAIVLKTPFLKAPITQLSVTANREALISASGEGGLRVWNLKEK